MARLTPESTGGPPKDLVTFLISRKLTEKLRQMAGFLAGQSRASRKGRRGRKGTAGSTALQLRKISQLKTENEIAKTVLDTAFKVHTNLGPGLLESVYEAVLAYELTKRGIVARRQVPIPIR